MVLELLLVGSAVFSGLSALENYQILRRRRRRTPAGSSASEPGPSTESEVNSEALALDCRFQLGTSSLGFAMAGTLINPLLLYPGVAGLLAVTGELFGQSYRALRDRQEVHVYTLVSISLSGCLIGQYYVMGSAAGFFYALSRKLLFQTRQQSRDSLTAIFQRHQPRSAWVLAGGVERETPVAQLCPGDRVVVGGGQVIPVDGVVLMGQASVDQQMLTGEAAPVEKYPGESVFAATLVLKGRLEVQVARTGQDTMVGEISRFLEQTIERPSNAQCQAEQLAERTALPTLATGILALPLLGPMGALAVINTHIGYRMSVLGSLNSLNYFEILSGHGVLVKDARVLDCLSRVDTVVFDKTGVLTRPQPRVSAIHCCAGFDEATVLGHAANAEQRQTHPLARAIVQAAQQRCLPILDIQQTTCHLGQGLTVEGVAGTLRVGSARFLAAAGITPSPRITAIQRQAHARGHTLVLVALDEVLMGAIELQPAQRPEAVQVVRELQAQGITVRILSGDHWQPTGHLARALGITAFEAELLPRDKAQIIRELQDAGRVVCYVGDGINDVGALCEAQVAVSLESASQMALDSADVVLMEDSLAPLSRLLEIGGHFETTRDDGFKMILVPSVLGATGILFFQFGLLETMLLKQLGLGAGLLRVTTPLWQARWRGSNSTARQIVAAKQPTGVVDSAADQPLAGVPAISGCLPQASPPDDASPSCSSRSFSTASMRARQAL